MKVANFKLALKEIGYPDISKWTKLPKIARFNVTTNGSFFNESGHATAEYKLDEANGLLLKRLVSKSNAVLTNSAILNIDEIICIEVLSPYGESVFNGTDVR